MSDLPDDTPPIQLVSLGTGGSPKLSFQKMGKATGPLPFDWVHSTMDGLMHFLTNDFMGFYAFTSQVEMQVPGSSKSVPALRSSMHAVCPDDTATGYDRDYPSQIDALKSMSAEMESILFIRVAAASEEIVF